jgi:LacI family transcriptional regulator
VLAVEDADLRKALRLIQAKACTELSAAEVATAIGVSRRLLDRKFQLALGHTIHDELQRTRVAEAKRLLAQTDDKLLVVAVRSGFAHAPQLCNVFKTVVGMSPMQYRKAARSCRETPVGKKPPASTRRS